MRQLFTSVSSPALHTPYDGRNSRQNVRYHVPDTATSWQNGRYKTDPREFGWTPTRVIGHVKLALFERDGVKMGYWYSTGTVRTVMKHPKRGWTQLFRRNLEEGKFQAVVENPRYHTNQSYYTTDSKFQKMFKSIAEK